MTTTRASNRRCSTTGAQTHKRALLFRQIHSNSQIQHFSHIEKVRILEPSSSSTTLLPGRVGWGRGDVFNSTDSHTGTGESSESGLSSWTGLLGSGTTGSPELDVESGDSDFLALSSDILSGQHGGVGLGVSTIFRIVLRKSDVRKTRLGRP